jgi:hypothetical protein
LWDRPFHKENAMAFGKAGMKLLRPLPHPIPSKVRVHNDRESG